MKADQPDVKVFIEEVNNWPAVWDSSYANNSNPIHSLFILNYFFKF